jgi:hypothetical protein
MCFNAGYDYEKAFQNTVEVCKQLMKQYSIPESRVVQHYDVCAKNCPSAIRAKGDWNRFKQAISDTTAVSDQDHYYRIRKSWIDSKSQIGAYKSLENAKKDWEEGYIIFDWNGKQVYPVNTVKEKCSLTGELALQFPVISKGCTGIGVSMLQTLLGTPVTGTWNDEEIIVFGAFQKNTNQTQDGICGKNGWTAVVEHIKSNTFK